VSNWFVKIRTNRTWGKNCRKQKEETKYAAPGPYMDLHSDSPTLSPSGHYQKVRALPTPTFAPAAQCNATQVGNRFSDTHCRKASDRILPLTPHARSLPLTPLLSGCPRGAGMFSLPKKSACCKPKLDSRIKNGRRIADRSGAVVARLDARIGRLQEAHSNDMMFNARMKNLQKLGFTNKMK
jgi:hypothetical protein